MLPTEFLDNLRGLEAAYLASSDPLRQSGFSGGTGRWRVEREIILEAAPRDGTFLDIGCANGFLLECLVKWAKARNVELVPYGLDCSEELVALAKDRFPAIRDHFFAANAWQWLPPQRFDYVYTLVDCVPATHLRQYLRDLLADAVQPGGTLIVGSYGSRSRNSPAQNVAMLIEGFGFPVAGSASADPSLANIAWICRS